MSIYRLEPPQCQHIKDNGLRCGSPALRSQAFCYHHERIHHPGQKGYTIPALETPEATTIAFRQIAQAAHDGTLALPVARLMLNAVRWAAADARKHSTHASEVVTELPPAMPPSVTSPLHPWTVCAPLTVCAQPPSAARKRQPPLIIRSPNQLTPRLQ